MPLTCGEVCDLLCAYILPPVGVCMKFGCGLQFLICCVLTLCGYVPGLVYACFVIGFQHPRGAREPFMDDWHKGKGKGKGKGW
mmetsp:Transcript_12880/g.34244  ORF Transcript_12880/g.34244 Transcript_12880/m.34244 type:complete len:83 (+) Transcript_12880:160-408(+)